MYQKGFVPPFFSTRVPTSRSINQAQEAYDTEFEEDLSDFEEYSGRRSEDSVRPTAFSLRSLSERLTQHSPESGVTQLCPLLMSLGPQMTISMNSMISIFNCQISQSFKNQLRDQLDLISFEFHKSHHRMLTSTFLCPHQCLLKSLGLAPYFNISPLTLFEKKSLK